MAVIITNMDMPKSCNDCMVRKCKAIDAQNGLTNRSKDCPLKSVDEMIEEIETDMSWDMYDENGNETDLHKRLMVIIHKYCDKEEKE